MYFNDWFWEIKICIAYDGFFFLKELINKAYFQNYNCLLLCLKKISLLDYFVHILALHTVNTCFQSS